MTPCSMREPVLIAAGALTGAIDQTTPAQVIPSDRMAALWS